MEDVKGSRKIIFMLAECKPCAKRYAVAPDPYFMGQWIFFERDNSMEDPTHICIGGLTCFKGHILDVTVKEAALSTTGDWLNIGSESAEPKLN